MNLAQELRAQEAENARLAVWDEQDCDCHCHDEPREGADEDEPVGEDWGNPDA